MFSNLSLLQASVQTEFPFTRGSFNWNQDRADTKPVKPGSSVSDNCGSSVRDNCGRSVSDNRDISVSDNRDSGASDNCDSSQVCLYDSDSSGLGTGGEISENCEAGESEQKPASQSAGRSVGALQEPPIPWWDQDPPTPRCHQEPPTPRCHQEPPTSQCHQEPTTPRCHQEGQRGMLEGERGRLESELGRISDRLFDMEEQLAKVG